MTCNLTAQSCVPDLFLDRKIVKLAVAHPQMNGIRKPLPRFPQAGRDDLGKHVQKPFYPAQVGNVFRIRAGIADRLHLAPVVHMADGVVVKPAGIP